MLIITKQKLDWFRKTFRSSLKFCVLKSSTTARHTHMHTNQHTHTHTLTCIHSKIYMHGAHYVNVCLCGRRRRRREKIIHTHVCVMGTFPIYSVCIFLSRSRSYSVSRFFFLPFFFPPVRRCCVIGCVHVFAQIVRRECVCVRVRAHVCIFITFL